MKLTIRYGAEAYELDGLEPAEYAQIVQLVANSPEKAWFMYKMAQAGWALDQKR